MSSDAELDLDDLALAAANGDRDALERLCKALQHPMYRLALRMLGYRPDAEDATQEILVRIVTNLGSFEGRSKFTTWAYTVAVRQLLRTRKRAVESSVASAERFGQVIDEGIASSDFSAESEAEANLLCGEVRIACSYGMLLALSRETRVAYILADMLGFTDKEGASICGTTPAAFRQRVSRGRKTMRTIIEDRCGLVDERNRCRCSRQVESSINLGVLDRDGLLYATHPGVEGPIETGTLRAAADELDIVEKIAAVYRSAPEFLAPETVWDRLREAAPTLLR
ncbi:MAG TPA: RNA polymerase sigma factor [Acidimicrobiales bacterium]|nr:RNA polymerase sigma factor [Acidimicrobiales bacterium]